MGTWDYKNPIECQNQIPYFKLSNGISHRCPISALLFLLVVEIIAILLRYSDNIIDDNKIKLCQLADDMTLFLTSTTSVLHAIDLYCYWGVRYRYAKLKLNKTKTEAYFIDFLDPLVYREDNIGISWKVKSFKTSDTWFSLDNEEAASLNITHKMNIITSILKSCQHQKLTLKGKITVLKSVVVPHILQFASLLPLKHKILTEFEVIFKFCLER